MIKSEDRQGFNIPEPVPEGSPGASRGRFSSKTPPGKMFSGTNGGISPGTSHADFKTR